MIVVKSRRELDIMRRAGALVGRCLGELRAEVRPGLTTGRLDELAEDLILRCGGRPAFKGYRGFPASICTSINEQVVHGIPGSRVLQEGDIISVDLGVIVDGFYGDAAITVPVGQADAEVLELLEVASGSLQAAIDSVRPGARLGDVSNAVQVYAESRGFSVVRDYCGHGIGRSMHEAPEIPNYGPAGLGPMLKPGMTLAIEPMVNLGGHEVSLDLDGWTVVTADGSRSAHFEHTVAVTEDGSEVFTAVGEERAS